MPQRGRGGCGFRPLREDQDRSAARRRDFRDIRPSQTFAGSPHKRILEWICARSESAGHGQAAVEFALVLTVGLIILVAAVQMALVGETALALGQVNYQGARYAALHQCATAADVAAYMTSVASPTLSGGNCGANMAVTVTDINGSSSASGSCATPGCAGRPRTFGSQVTVSVLYTIPPSQMFLPNPFLGISFPATLSSSEAAMSE
jgi:Flp pilus assembly protein TadG